MKYCSQAVQWIGSTIILLSLVSCQTSFQASQPIDKHFKQLNLQTAHPYDDHFAYLLRHALRSGHVDVTEQASISLRILSNGMSQSTQNTLSMASEFKTLGYTATIQLFDQKQQALAAPMSFTTQRAIALSNQQPLASEKEITMMEHTMQYDIVVQISHYLRHFNKKIPPAHEIIP